MSEVKVWAVGVGNPPRWWHSRKVKKSAEKAVQIIKGLDGLIGVHPDEKGRGTLVLFRTENDAKIGKNVMTYEGIPTGKGIGEVYIDSRYVGGEDA